MLLPDAFLGTALQRFLFDFDFLDLMLWFPKLSWLEFAATATVVSVWKLGCEALDRVSGPVARRVLADALVWVATRIRPV